jgi:prepilin-type N-terminal cleavage/methylation domain-containing protein
MRNDRRTRRRGFTLMEVTIVSALMALLAVLLSTMWINIVRPAAEISSRCYVTQEAQFAMASLAADLSGSLPGGDARLGGKQVLGFAPGGWMVTTDAGGNSQLWLCFDGGTPPNGRPDWGGVPDVVVEYLLDGAKLARYDRSAGTTFVVADGVVSFRVTPPTSDGMIQIALALRRGSVTRTYTMYARAP